MGDKIADKVEMTTYNLSLPKSTYIRLRSIANLEGTTVKELINTEIKDFIKAYKGV